jgi:phi LC3 family holin
MKINWKVRKNNLLFLAQVAMAVLIPILAYFGLTLSDVVTWQILGQTLLGAISNPYVIVLVIGSVFNTVTDPTTKGIGDSDRALSYDEPN